MISRGHEVRINKTMLTGFVWLPSPGVNNYILIFRDGSAAGPYSGDELTVIRRKPKAGERMIKTAILMGRQ